MLLSENFPVIAQAANPPHPQTILLPLLWDPRTTLLIKRKATSRAWVLGRGLEGVAPQERNKFFR